MNEFIKKVIDDFNCGYLTELKLKHYLITICQEQINECAKNDVVPMNYKNIAE